MFATTNESAADRLVAEAVLIANGSATKWIPLNGGSDTRAAAREYHRQYAIALRAPFRATGFCVTIGGQVPGKKRGWRYCIAARNACWLPRRKAKRAIRKGLFDKALRMRPPPASSISASAPLAIMDL